MNAFYSCMTIPVCPHCDYQHIEWFDLCGELNDQEQKECTCEDCGKKFIVKMKYAYEFDTYMSLKP